MTIRNTVPIVKIFIRFNEGPLCCINDSVQLEQEIERFVFLPIYFS